MFKTVVLNFCKFIHSFICLFSKYLPSANDLSATVLVAGYFKSLNVPVGL